VDLYDAAKRETGKVDFADLLLAARNLVRDNRMVRNDLQARFTHIFVDEFQDTDPLQAEILSLLAADDPEVTDWKEARPAGGKLFLVGDPKQSIYRFRRADVVLYGDLARRLHDRNVGEARLSKSFRSVPMIQRLVNAAFEESMYGDRETGQPR
jgi:ATP-dependent exoDNAse (exonuclease V) beta subunit